MTKKPMKKKVSDDLKGTTATAYREIKEVEKVPQGEKDSFFFEDLQDRGPVEPEPMKRPPLRQPQQTKPPRPPKNFQCDASDQLTQTKSDSKVPEIIIDGEIFYRVEGDMLLDVDEFDLYQQQMAQQAQSEAARLAQKVGFGEVAISELVAQTSELVGMMEGGKLVRWAPGTVLTYCVLKNTFPRSEWYEEVVENMQLATAAWEEICGVDFEYRYDLDDSDSLRPQGVLFPVRYIAASGAFIAAAFFPTDAPYRRRVLIDPSYFTTSFDHVGVLRHELGHTLGFRHEHIRSGAPRVCPDEDVTGTIDLTDYDPKSVMHYFCGGVGSRNLAITDVDRAGAQMVYGVPLTRFDLLKP